MLVPVWDLEELHGYGLLRWLLTTQSGHVVMAQ